MKTIKELEKELKKCIRIYPYRTDYYTEIGFKIQTLKEVVEIIKEINNPYPEDIFPKISDKEWVEIHKILIEKMNIPLDRVSADLMRRARRIMKDDIIKKLEGEEK